MAEKKLLSAKELIQASGGWSMSDVEAGEREEFERLKNEYLRLEKLAMNDSSYRAQADEADAAMTDYFMFLNQKYTFMEQNGLL